MCQDGVEISALCADGCVPAIAWRHAAEGCCLAVSLSLVFRWLEGIVPVSRMKRPVFGN